MEAYLKDLDVWCWRFLENERNYGGIHLTARPDACDALLRLLDTLAIEGPGAYRTVPLRNLDPRAVAKIARFRFREFKRLRITLAVATEELRQMRAYEPEPGLAHVEITPVILPDLRVGIEGVRRGECDYCILPRRARRRGLTLGPLDRESERFWFWPCFGHLWPV